jgi:chloramphenicol 3-O-phosphotransferase
MTIPGQVAILNGAARPGKASIAKDRKPAAGLVAKYPAPVARWQNEVHRGKAYDLEVGTPRLSPGQCAEVIKQFLGRKTPGASSFERMAPT